MLSVLNLTHVSFYGAGPRRRRDCRPSRRYGRCLSHALRCRYTAATDQEDKEQADVEGVGAIWHELAIVCACASRFATDTATQATIVQKASARGSRKMVPVSPLALNRQPTADRINTAPPLVRVPTSSALHLASAPSSSILSSVPPSPRILDSTMQSISFLTHA